MSLEDTSQEAIAASTAHDHDSSFGEMSIATATQEQPVFSEANESCDENPSSDEIATSAAKHGDDFVATRKDLATGGQQQLQAQPLPTEANNLLDYQQDSLPQLGEDEGQQGGEEGLFAGSATGDESNASNPMNEDEEGDGICQPVIPLANSEFQSTAETSANTTPTHRRTNSDTNRKKRLCRFPGCTRVIKSQGHCQRHGAKAKRCKVEGCDKQAQGTHNGMCKRHWRAVHFPDQVAAKAENARKKELEEQPPPPFGESVYDNVLPASIAYRPSFASHQFQLDKTNAGGTSEPPTDMAASVSTPTSTDTQKPTPTAALMPLVNFLRDGALHKEIGWHRQAERRARGIVQCASLSVHMEPWEKQLALVEILLLSGGTPKANFRDLAHAWGRERGFHQVLASSVCTRRGEVERKKRSDAGKKASRQQQQPTTAPPTKRPKPATPTPTTPAPGTIYHPPSHQALPPQQPQQQHITAHVVQPQAPPLQVYQNPGVQWHQQPTQQQQQQPVVELQPQAQEQQSDVQPIINIGAPAAYN